MALVVNVAGPVGPKRVYVEMEAFTVDGRKQVAPRTAKPSRERIHRDTDLGPRVERARCLLLPGRRTELGDVLASGQLAHRSYQPRLDYSLGVVDVPPVNSR